jgi:hypothetical protein
MKKIGQGVLGLILLDRRLKKNGGMNNVFLKGKGEPVIHLKRKRSEAECFELNLGCKKDQRSFSTQCELERKQMSLPGAEIFSDNLEDF